MTIFFIAAIVASFIAGTVLGKRRHVSQRRTHPKGDRPHNRNTEAARQAVIEWADSGGFAAVHNSGGSPETITDDMIAFLWRKGFKIAPIAKEDWF